MNLACSIAFIFIATACDLQSRKIPNKLTFPFIIIGILLGIYAGQPLNPLLGCLLGGSVFLIPFLLSGMGAGDVKAMAALGTLVGPSAIFQTFLYTGVIGGVIALAYYIITCDVQEKTRAAIAALGVFATFRLIRGLVPQAPKKRRKFPYAPVMALGYLAYLAWGNLV